MDELAGIEGSKNMKFVLENGEKETPGAQDKYVKICQRRTQLYE